MSVFTVVSSEELQTFLSQFDVGSLLDFSGISAGIENSNYFVNTSKGAFVLTLYEKHNADEINFSLQLSAFLASHQLSVSHPIAAQDSRLQRPFLGKPTVLSQRIVGESVLAPTLAQCAELGRALANVHQVSQTFPLHEPKLDGHLWRQATLEKLQSHLAPEYFAALQSAVLRHQSDAELDLPQGALHTDLFRDNVLFDGEQLSGIIDFNSAMHGALLYDLAVVLNDWCSQADGALNLPRSRAVVTAYQAVRPFTESEHQLWPQICELAALRFWLSRLLNLHFRQVSQLTCDKDPAEYRRLFQQRHVNPVVLEQLYDH